MKKHYYFWTLLTATLAACEAAPASDESAMKQAEFDTPLGRMTLPYEERDGLAIYQGDIVLGRLDEIGAQQRSAVIRGRNFQWPMSVVFFENTLTSGGVDDPRVTAAVAAWQRFQPINFERSNTAPDRIRFVRHPVVSEADSPLGWRGGVQDIRLGDATDAVTAKHELGHALGLMHEHTRPDRDANVQVRLGCVQNGKTANFSIFGGEGMSLSRYDIGSLMHFASNAFLDRTKRNPNGTPCTATILRLDGGTIPRATEPSQDDFASLSSLYGSGNTNRVGGPASQLAAQASSPLAAASPDARTVFRQQSDGSWANLGTPGGTGRVLRLYAGNAALYAVIVESGNIFQHQSGQTWTQVGGPGYMFAVDSAGELYGVSPDTANVLKRVSGTWVNLFSPNGEKVSAIYAGGREGLALGSCIYATSSRTGDLFKHDGTTWRRIGGPGASFAVLEDGTIFGLTPDRTQVWRHNGNGNWTAVGGPVAAIYGGGPKLVATTSANEVWTLSSGTWFMLNIGPIAHPIAVTSASVFALDAARSEVYRIGL